MKTVKWGCMWGCLIVSVTLSYSQQPTTDTLATAYLEEVVVAANRWEQNLREIAARVTRVSEASIRLQNPQTAADLLALSHQVFIQKSQLGGGSPMIRGFATNRVLLVIDGVRMNNAIFRGGNVQNVISLDANTIRESEVIFGPGSVIYGSDAIGGVMDFHTLRPELATGEHTLIRAATLLRYASANNENTGHAHVNIGWKKWSLLTSVTRSDYDDLRMGRYGPVAYTRPDYQQRIGEEDVAVANPQPNMQVGTGYRQTNLLQKIRFVPNRHWELNYAFHFSRTSDVPRYDRLILKNADGTFANAEWYYGPQAWQMQALTLHHRKSHRLADQIRLSAAYQRYAESRHNRNFSGSNRNRLNERFEEVDAISVNLDADKQWTANTSIFYGFEFVHNSVRSTAQRRDIVTGSTSPLSTRYPDGSRWRSTAAYASARHVFSDRWLLNASARYSYIGLEAPFDLTFFDFPFQEARLRTGAANGSVGAVYTPPRNTKWYLNLSSGFRAPNIDDIGKVFDSQPGSVVVPNPGLRPETAYNAEIGYTGRFAPGLTVDVTAYTTWLDDAIVRGFFTFNGNDSIDFDGVKSQVLALQNTSEVFIRGVQAALVWQWHPRWKMQSSMNLQRGREREPTTAQFFSPTHVAPAFGATQISYSVPRFTFVTYVQYNGAIRYERLALSERADSHLYTRDSNGNPYAPAWWTLNAKASWQTTQWLWLDVGLENILDKRYRPYSSGLTAPGRNVIIAVRTRL